MRVVDPGREARLALGAYDVVLRRAGQQPHALDRHVPVEHLVASEVHDAGAAASDLSLERVPACNHV